MTTVTVDDDKRVRLPDAEPRQVFSYEPNADGTIKLVPVTPKRPRRIVSRLVQKGDAMFPDAAGGNFRLAAMAQARRLWP